MNNFKLDIHFINGDQYYTCKNISIMYNTDIFFYAFLAKKEFLQSRNQLIHITNTNQETLH